MSNTPMTDGLITSNFKKRSRLFRKIPKEKKKKNQGAIKMNSALHSFIFFSNHYMH